MKIFLPVVALFLLSLPSIGQTKCEIKAIYQGVSPDSDTMVLTSGGDMEEPELILVPTKLEEGKYKVSLTKKASNLYKVDGKDIYIETRYCYEYATYDDAILIIESNYGYTKGEVIFIE